MNSSPQLFDVTEKMALLLLRASLNGWPAEEWENLQDWHLRASNDATKRCNSVWPLSQDQSANLNADIAACEQWYRARNKPVIFQINDRTAPPSLDSALAACGYEMVDPSSVMVRDLASFTPDQAPPFIELEHRPRAFVMNALCPPDLNAASRKARANLFNRIRKPMTFALACPGGEPVAGGMAVVDDEFTGIFSMHTHNASRRRGLARDLLARLLAWSQNMGAKMAYLQIEHANSAAMSLYREFGFQHAFNYHYRMKPGA